MKNKFILTLLLTCIITYHLSAQANTTLSNLTSPTSVNQSLIPSLISKDLGSSSFGWRNLYLSGSLYLNGIKFLDNNGNANTFAGATNNSTNSGSSNTFFGNFSGNKNTSGSYNTFFGASAGLKNETGSSNTYTGCLAGGFSADHASGSSNCFYGFESGGNNLSGYANCYYGYYSGYSSSASHGNVALGAYAAQSNVGSHNVAVGLSALNSTQANDNTAVGAYSSYNSTIGIQNCYFGYGVITDITNSGSDNSFFGYLAGVENTSGNFNCGFGDFAFVSNEDGSGNTIFGTQALMDNISGSNNVAVGYQAITDNETGEGNTAVGADAGNEGSLNSAFGYRSLETTHDANNCSFGSTSLANLIEGSSNAAFGANSGAYLTTGSANTLVGDSAGMVLNIANDNTFIGSAAGVADYDGETNTFVGVNSGFVNTSGNENVFIGKGTGQTNATGNQNTCLGRGANVSGGSFTNATAVGYNVNVTASDNMLLGTASVTGWGFGVAPSTRAIKVGTSSSNGNAAYLTTGGVWTDVSDRNKKEDITSLDKNDARGKIVKLYVSKWKYSGTKDEHHIGPMADDFHTLFEVGDDSSISSMDKTGVLFLAVQSLYDENKALESSNDELKNENAIQQEQLNDLKNLLARIKLRKDKLDQSLSECCGSNPQGLHNTIH